MLLQMQMQIYWGVFFHFLICLCLVGFNAAKCVPEKCGSMNVSFPFWIHNSHCGAIGWNYSIACRKDENSGMLAPFLIGFEGYVNGSLTDIEYYKIKDIDYKGSLMIDSSSIKANSCKGGDKLFAPDLNSPFTVSASNSFVALGTNIYGTYSLPVLSTRYLIEAKCLSLYNSHPNNKSRSHPSYCPKDCCEIRIPENWWGINFTAAVLDDSTVEGLNGFSSDSSSCASSILMDPSIFNKDRSYGLTLNWGVGDQNCSEAEKTGNSSCSTHAKCSDSPAGFGHVCKCLPGYEGHGYKNGTGCTDINECSHTNLTKCVAAEKGGICHNLAGSYNCSCARGHVGDGFRNGTGCTSTRSNSLVFLATFGSASSFVVVSSVACLLVWWLKKRHLKFVEAKYYQLLQQHIYSTVGRESLKIFPAKELARASNNYSKEMFLGSGGFGTVFKGILSDDTLIAIKKSKQALTVEDDHEFLNEVTILSQINHRNIVKLLGCCIQTKFPLLVSEFISNGTLFEHLHSKERILSWTSRLQIAIETGEALAYLHSGASQPIFHRDVKSSNILLNEKLSPKVADFGISRLISISSNTHVTTNNIKGTWGYLDPEYFQTFQLTEKSDVYSFGVVLVELLTALKPLCEEREEMSLSRLFLSKLNQNCLTEILDNRVLEKENEQQMEDMAKIARECLQLERRKRPSMKEVVGVLAWIRGGIRNTKFHNSEKHDDAVFEKKSTSRKASQMSYKFRSYTFPSGGTSLDFM